MNCDEAGQIWDEYRDGSLEATRRGPFAAHLADCPHCAARYEAESQWLHLLKRSAVRRDDQPFVAATLDRWQRADAADAPRPLAVLRWATAGAIAAAMLLVTAVWMATQLEHDSGEPARIAAVAEPEEDTRLVDGSADPVSTLMLDMTRHLDAQPAPLQQTITGAASMNLRSLVSMLGELGESVPDQPAPTPRS